MSPVFSVQRATRPVAISPACAAAAVAEVYRRETARLATDLAICSADDSRILRRTNARGLGVSQSAEKPESSHSSPHADAAPSSRPRPRRHLVAGHRIAVDQPHPIVQLPTVDFAAAKHPPHRHTEPSGCPSDRLYHSR